MRAGHQDNPGGQDGPRVRMRLHSGDEGHGLGHHAQPGDVGALTPMSTAESRSQAASAAPSSGSGTEIPGRNSKRS